MRNTKEIQSILAVIYYLNRLSDHEDQEIAEVLDYAFYRLFNGSTRMLLLATIGRTREDSMPEIMEILRHDTQYHEYQKMNMPLLE